MEDEINLPEDQLSEEEKLRMENEIMKLKIQAQFGGMSGGGENIPPEIEHEFLKNILAFEEQYTKTDYTPVKVGALLGNPKFENEKNLDDATFEKEWNRLMKLLEEKNLNVDFIRERNNRFKYRFITEELFEHETDAGIMQGMIFSFIYEEFHPDHEKEISDRSMQFLSAWFERNSESMQYGVVSHFIQPNAVVLSQEEIIAKIQLVFDSYRSFENCGFHIFEVKFQLSEDESEDERQQGIGHCEGRIKYDAILESGERKTIEGPFKLYMTRDFDWWSIFYFVMEGFE